MFDCEARWWGLRVSNGDDCAGWAPTRVRFRARDPEVRVKSCTHRPTCAPANLSHALWCAPYTLLSPRRLKPSKVPRRPKPSKIPETLRGSEVRAERRTWIRAHAPSERAVTPRHPGAAPVNAADSSSVRSASSAQNSGRAPRDSVIAPSRGGLLQRPRREVRSRPGQRLPKRATRIRRPSLGSLVPHVRHPVGAAPALEGHATHRVSCREGRSERAASRRLAVPGPCASNLSGGSRTKGKAGTF